MMDKLREFWPALLVAGVLGFVGGRQTGAKPACPKCPAPAPRVDPAPVLPDVRPAPDPEPDPAPRPQPRP